ncbi:MAG: 3-oxoadipate enol-lactone hydrolase, partial [Anaerolineales bacterium]
PRPDRPNPRSGRPLRPRRSGRRRRPPGARPRHPRMNRAARRRFRPSGRCEADRWPYLRDPIRGSPGGRRC